MSRTKGQKAKQKLENSLSKLDNNDLEELDVGSVNISSNSRKPKTPRTNRMTNSNLEENKSIDSPADLDDNHSMLSLNAVENGEFDNQSNSATPVEGETDFENEGIETVKVLITLGQLLWTKRLRAYNL